MTFERDEGREWVAVNGVGMGNVESKPRDLGNDRGYSVANGSVGTEAGMATDVGEGGIELGS